MSSEDTDDEDLDAAVQQVYDFAVNLLVEQDMNKQQAVATLQNEGLDYGVASLVVNQVCESLQKEYGKHMFFGLLWLVGGIVVTVATYANAQGGGTYVVAWGAILYGGIQFLRCLFKYFKYS